MAKKESPFSELLRTLIRFGIDAGFMIWRSKVAKERELSIPKTLEPYFKSAEELLRKAEERSKGEYEEMVEAIRKEVREEAPAGLGRGEIAYCLECIEKHIGGASKLLEEAIVFYDRAGKMDEKVQRKIRSVVSELAGMHDDVPPGSPKLIMDLLHRADSIRKKIWGKKLEIGLGVREDLLEIKREIDSLYERVFDVAQRVRVGGPMQWCKEWAGENFRPCYELMKRAMKEEGYKPITKEEFEEEFYRLTRRRLKKTVWDAEGRLIGGEVEKKSS